MIATNNFTPISQSRSVDTSGQKTERIASQTTIDPLKSVMDKLQSQSQTYEELTPPPYVGLLADEDTPE